MRTKPISIIECWSSLGNCQKGRPLDFKLMKTICLLEINSQPTIEYNLVFSESLLILAQKEIWREQTTKKIQTKALLTFSPSK